MFLMKRRPPGSARTDTLFHYTTLFRSQGAPLAPVFHAALAATLEKPLAVLNLGGVANVTWIGPGGTAPPIGREDTLIAFDTGPGNALLDDWVLAHTGRRSEEHTSELQSLMRISYAVFCLKKKTTHRHIHKTQSPTI